jgi:hypothetical protein
MIETHGERHRSTTFRKAGHDGPDRTIVSFAIETTGRPLIEFLSRRTLPQPEAQEKVVSRPSQEGSLSYRFHQQKFCDTPKPQTVAVRHKKLAEFLSQSAHFGDSVND